MNQAQWIDAIREGEVISTRGAIAGLLAERDATIANLEVRLLEGAEVLRERDNYIQQLREGISASDAAFFREKEKVKKLRAALQLAQKWLANCTPVVELPFEKPLPVITEALADTEDK